MKKKFKAILRIISFAFLFLGSIFFPWPLIAALTVIFIAIFSWFWEAVLIGFILASIYGFPRGSAAFLFGFFIFSFPAALLTEEYIKYFIQEKNVVSRAIVALAGGAAIAFFWLVFKILIYVF